MSKRLNLTLPDDVHARLTVRARRCGYRSAAQMMSGLAAYLVAPAPEEFTAAEEEIRGFFMEFEAAEPPRYEIRNRL